MVRSRCSVPIAGFRKLRQTIIAQEQAHHATGWIALDALVSADVDLRDSLRRRAGDYLALVEQVFEEAGPLFEQLDRSPNSYRSRFEALLPKWLLQ